jgi:hypothetical protein
VLIQLRVENHRSLRDEQILSAVASGAGDKDDPRLIRSEGLGEALLPALALYGANASGKSNVLGALGFMRDAVIRSHRLWEPEGGTPQEAFALSGRSAEPSLYEVDILVERVRHRYGFVLGAERVEEEWLYAWPQGRKQTWFTREGDAFDFSRNLGGENETIRALTRPNSLFLSAAAQNNHPALSPIFAWFRATHLEMRRGHGMRPRQRSALGEILAPRQRPSPAEAESGRAQEREALLRLIQAADVGIVDIQVERERTGSRFSMGGAIRPLVRTNFLLRHKTNGPEEVWLPLEWESAGTITLLSIAAQILAALRSGSLFCVDELEASLHPMVALQIVRLFNDPAHNPRGAQLVFTTHDTNLLGNVLGDPPLRRDQIWFTEKDETGATKLYPLTDFHPRKEENLERGYLQGRYGAVPFLGQLVAPPADGEPS